MKETLFRLIKDGMVVGYEYYFNGKLYHVNRILKKNDNISSNLPTYQDMAEWYGLYDYPNIHYVPHDRKDMFTGITLDDGTKVFQRDEVEYERECIKTDIIEWDDEICGFMLGTTEIGCNIKFLRVIGIQGVKSI